MYVREDVMRSDLLSRNVIQCIIWRDCRAPFFLFLFCFVQQLDQGRRCPRPSSFVMSVLASFYYLANPCEDKRKKKKKKEGQKKACECHDRGRRRTNINKKGLFLHNAMLGECCDVVYFIEKSMGCSEPTDPHFKVRLS